jgi:type I restriction enzyme S subunit
MCRRPPSSPYPIYKDSGLPWSAQVPGHWELVPNRGLVRKRKVLVGKRHGDYRLLSLTKQGIIVRDISTGKGKFSSDMGTSQEVRNGDLVFCLFDVPETPRTVGLSNYEGMITGAYTVFESLDRTDSRYFELFYRAMDDRKLLSPLYSGLRNTIRPEIFLGTKTPQPPPDEQTAIVRFLNWSNSRLERAIRAKRNVIALLNEQKQAIIHHAVTRGLDPCVSLKPSGISWLENIPKHWEIRRGKDLFREVDQRSKAGLEELLSVSHITGVTPRSQKNITMFKAASYAGSKLCMPGDLVINTMWAWMGALSVSRYEGIVSPSYGVYRPKNVSGLTSDYADYLLRTRLYVAEYTVRSTGITSSRLRLYPEQFLRVPILLPPEKEQESIAHYIAAETKGLERAILTADREIALLREYRTRLVADVVTGKLDVREAVAHLPEDAPPEADALDDVDAIDEAELADEEAVA